MLPFVKAMRICSNSGMRPDMVRPLMYSDADLTLAAPSGESVSSLYASLSGSKKSELLSANKDAWFKYAVEMPHPQRMLLLGLGLLPALVAGKEFPNNKGAYRQNK